MLSRTWQDQQGMCCCKSRMAVISLLPGAYSNGSSTWHSLALTIGSAAVHHAAYHHLARQLQEHKAYVLQVQHDGMGQQHVRIAPMCTCRCQTCLQQNSQHAPPSATAPPAPSAHLLHQLELVLPVHVALLGAVARVRAGLDGAEVLPH
jgi:hypothetical protein